jgi:hypothetical protein
MRNLQCLAELYISTSEINCPLEMPSWITFRAVEQTG